MDLRAKVFDVTGGKGFLRRRVLAEPRHDGTQVLALTVRCAANGFTRGEAPVWFFHRSTLHVRDFEGAK